MKRKISALAAAFLLPAALVLAVPSVSFAAGAAVTYDGGNKLKETDMELNIPVVPGSVETTEIKLQNATGSSTNWYMSSEVLESLEDANREATGAAYTYTLSYTGPDGEKLVIYDSSWVGGSESEGLLEVNASLGNGGYFVLGNLGENEVGTVSLTIGLNGESAINNYQTMKGRLQTAYAVEVVPQGGGGGGNTVNEVIERRVELVELPDENVAKSSGMPKTGDESRVLLYVILGMMSGIGCMVMGIGLFRKDTEEGEKGNGKA